MLDTVANAVIGQESSTFVADGQPRDNERLAMTKATTSDFLGRKSPPQRSVEWPSLTNGEIDGWISVDYWGFEVYRITDSLQEHAAFGAIVDYPYFPVHQPARAQALLEEALAHLKDYGCSNAYLELPVDCHGPRAVIESTGNSR